MSRCNKSKAEINNNIYTPNDDNFIDALFDNEWTRGGTDAMQNNIEHFKQYKNNDVNKITDENVENPLHEIKYAKHEERRKNKKSSKKT